MGKISGLFFFVAGFVILMGITTSEIFYPGYSVRSDFISTLASSPPPDSIIIQPSASIFNFAMIVAGLSIIAACALGRKQIKDNILLVFLLLMGVGTLGVGVFPANTGLPHLVSAFFSFAAGGVAAILSFRFLSSPFKYLSVILGLITLSFLFAGEFLPTRVVSLLGNGGTERFVAYPLTIWILGLGGYLMGKPYSK